MLDAQEHNQRQYLLTLCLGGKRMNETHKGHNIIASVSRSAGTRQWKSQVKIIWSEDGKGRVSTLDVDRVFNARREAEMGALIFAKKWIDDGKPQPPAKNF
jgi:hypothetical protein